MKMYHIADIHADDNNLDEVKKCCTAIQVRAEEEEPDLIVIAGDVFNSRYVRLDSEACKYIFWTISYMAEIAPVAIVAGTPSHEGHAPETLYFAGNYNHNVYVATSPDQACLKDGRLSPLFSNADKDVDAIISFMPTPTKQFFQTELGILESNDQVANALSPIFAGFGAKASEYDCPHILMGHFSVRGAAISDAQVMIGMDIEIGKDQIGLANPDLVCLGHIHKAQFLAPNIYYSGSVFRTDFGEVEDKGFYRHDLTLNTYGGYTVDSEFIPTPSRKLITVREDFTESDIREIDTTLYSLSPDEIEGSHIRVYLKVYQDEAVHISKEQLEEFYMSAGAESATVNIIHVPRENVRSEQILKLDRLRDKIREMAALKDEEVDESILAKADLLESEPEDSILTQVANGYHDSGLSAS